MALMHNIAPYCVALGHRTCEKVPTAEHWHLIPTKRTVYIVSARVEWENRYTYIACSVTT